MRSTKYSWLLAFFLLLVTSGSAWCADHLGEAEKLYSAGQYGAAEKMLLSLLKSEPKNLAGHYMLGNCLYRLGRIDEAKKQYEYVIEVEPNGVVGGYCRTALQMASGPNAAVGQSGSSSAAPSAPGASQEMVTLFFGTLHAAQFAADSPNLVRAKKLCAECDSRLAQIDTDLANNIAQERKDSQQTMLDPSAYGLSGLANSLNSQNVKSRDAAIESLTQNSKVRRKGILDSYVKTLQELGGDVR